MANVEGEAEMAEINPGPAIGVRQAAPYAAQIDRALNLFARWIDAYEQRTKAISKQ